MSRILYCKDFKGQLFYDIEKLKVKAEEIALRLGYTHLDKWFEILIMAMLYVAYILFIIALPHNKNMLMGRPSF